MAATFSRALAALVVTLAFVANLSDAAKSTAGQCLFFNGQSSSALLNGDFSLAGDRNEAKGLTLESWIYRRSELQDWGGPVIAKWGDRENRPLYDRTFAPADIFAHKSSAYTGGVEVTDKFSSNDRVYFTNGTSANGWERLFDIPLATAGFYQTAAKYVIEIDVSLDYNNLPKKALHDEDNDLFIGISDGTNVVGFQRQDKFDPTLGKFVSGVSGNMLSSRNVTVGDAWAQAGAPGSPAPGRSQLFPTSVDRTPTTFRVTITVDNKQASLVARVGTQETSKPHTFTRQLDLNKKLTLVGFSEDKGENYGFVSIGAKVRTDDRSFALFGSGGNYFGQGGFQLRFSDGSIEQLTGYSVPVDSWAHYAATYDGSHMRVYVNGNEVAAKAVAGSKPIALTADNVYVGRDGNGLFYEGRLDEVRVWNVSRSAAEIQAQYAVLLYRGSDTVPPFHSVTAHPGLLAYYRFDDASAAAVAKDHGPLGNNAALHDTVRVPSDAPLRDTPDAPTKPVESLRTESAWRVQWQAPDANRASIVRYRVKVINENGNEDIEEPSGVLTEFGKSGYSSSNQTFKVSIEAINSVGGSGFGAVATIRTNGLPNQPGAPFVTVQAEDSIKACWHAPENNGVRITAYQLQFTNKTDSAFSSSAVRSVNMAELCYTATELGNNLTLSAGLEYRFRVRAQNGVGWSAFSEAAVLATAPRAERNLVGALQGKRVVYHGNARIANVANCTARSCPAFEDCRVTGCSGHGSCDTSGACSCEKEWRGLHCSIQSCQHPDQKAQNVTCSGHGTCQADGTCLCTGATALASGWSGENCEIGTCPGSAAFQCSGHGQCDSTRGVCQCLAGYRGAACEKLCGGYSSGPDANVCSGHGSCSHNVSAPGLCACVTGYSGTGCQHTCPGFDGQNASSVCSSNGTCKDDGTCECAAGYRGSDCSKHCPGHVDGAADSTVCSSKGTCSSAGECTCSPGYRGDDCSKHCPGHVDGAADSTVCSSKGTCSSAGACMCSPGYRGDDCSKHCPGHVDGAADSTVCSGNGTCHANGTCTCATGYVGAGCQHRCPGFDGSASASICSGHGSCNGDGTCTCAAGYRGDDCSKHCPGHVDGAADSTVCSSNGTCGADGTCTCAAGYRGSDCSKHCPGHVDGAADSTVCSSKGTCSSAGACTCSPGYRGSDCSKHCPGHVDGAADSTVCSSKGTCSSAGACTCAAGYRGDDCSKHCPGHVDGAAESTVCSGNGTCGATGVCTCAAGFRGDDCSKHCPGHVAGAADATACSGHGTCEANGTCSCSSGFRGDACHLTCPSNNGTLCSGHGTCGTDGLCACSSGYRGSDCAYLCPGVTRAPIWYRESEADLARLPSSVSDRGSGGALRKLDSDILCSGHGACGTSGAQTGQCGCETGWVGVDCGSRCPGFDGSNAASICSGKGTCGAVANATLAANTLPYVVDARCTCEAGRRGDHCQFECPGFPGGSNDSLVCNSHGACLANGTCACSFPYKGTNCSECAAGSIVVSLSGGGVQCIGCPLDSEQRVCSGHGSCQETTVNGNKAAQCQCATGYTGERCDQCQSGYRKLASGECRQCPACVRGTCEVDDASNATATMCRCEIGYVGPLCSKSCPAPNNDLNRTCSNQGECYYDADSQTAKCDCNRGYRGRNSADCSEGCPENPDVFDEYGVCTWHETRNNKFHASCPGNCLTFTEAQSLCDSSNARLCTKTDLFDSFKRSGYARQQCGWVNTRNALQNKYFAQSYLDDSGSAGVRGLRVCGEDNPNGPSSWGTRGWGAYCCRHRTIEKSCREISAAGLSQGSGWYTIDPDGQGADNAISVFCDMDFEGGGWTRVFSCDKVDNPNINDPFNFTVATHAELGAQQLVLLAGDALQVHIRTTGRAGDRSITTVRNATSPVFSVLNLRESTPRTLNAPRGNDTDADANWYGPMKSQNVLSGASASCGGTYEYPGIVYDNCKNNNGNSGLVVRSGFCSWGFEDDNGDRAELMEVYIR